jgi:hypothetical protein
MASWKKIIVSGSSAELAALQVDNLTSGQVVIGGGSAGDLTTTAINGTGDILATTGATGVSMSGSFSGSFFGDGSGLTGMATTLSGSTDSGDFEVSLLTQFLTVQGTTDEIETSASGQTITIGLPDNVTITGDLTVNGGDLISTASTFNLLNSGVSTINFGADSAGGATAVNIGSSTSVTTVKDDLVVEGDLTVNGDLTYLNVTNLYVEDRFILLNSGSTSGDGGIIIQSGSADQGKAFFYDESENRWAYADGISGSATGATPEAFAAMVVQNDGEGPVTYQKNGNIRVTNTGDIFIYS